MAIFYPAMKMKMGKWKYYVVRMTMEDVAKNIGFAHDVHENPTLSSWIQRAINDNRVKKQIVSYLSDNDHRFFSSIVVAGLQGSPEFFGVDVTNDKQFEMVKDRLQDTFGLISFDDTIETYALDGQHRLSAIKKLITDPGAYTVPDDFKKETISVIYLLQDPNDNQDDFIKDFRRVFANLNRHAKPVDKNTVVIMDEDDRFAIATRNLIADNDYFKLMMHENANTNISETSLCDYDRANESLPPSSPALLTIVGLYKMIVELLWIEEYRMEWGQLPRGTNFARFIQTPPTDDQQEILHTALTYIWDGFIDTFPILSTALPNEQRKLNQEDIGDDKNLILYRPVVQTALIAPLIRRLLDHNNISFPKSKNEVVKTLKPLKFIPLDLFDDLWKNFLIILNDRGEYIMRNEQRAEVMKVANNICDWIIGIEDYTEEGIGELKNKWASLLIPPGDNELETEVFKKLENIREEISNL